MPKESNPELRAQNKEPQNFRLVPETLRKIGDSGSGVWDKQNRLSGTGDKLKDRFKKDGIKWGFRVCVTSRLDARAPDECTFANLLDFVCDKFLHFSKTGTANVLGTGVRSVKAAAPPALVHLRIDPKDNHRCPPCIRADSSFGCRCLAVFRQYFIGRLSVCPHHRERFGQHRPPVVLSASSPMSFSGAP